MSHWHGCINAGKLDKIGPRGVHLRSCAFMGRWCRVTRLQCGKLFSHLARKVVVTTSPAHFHGNPSFFDLVFRSVLLIMEKRGQLLLQNQHALLSQYGRINSYVVGIASFIILSQGASNTTRGQKDISTRVKCKHWIQQHMLILQGYLLKEFNESMTIKRSWPRWLHLGKISCGIWKLLQSIPSSSSLMLCTPSFSLAGRSQDLAVVIG